MLEIKDLSVKTRHLIYERVNYVFEPGKLYGIVAINGSGKTTLFRAMMKLIPMSGGSVQIDGKDIDKCRKEVFYYESFEWFDGNLTGMDYLRFVKKMWESDICIEAVVQEWQMEEFVKVPIRKYSLGMKQRLIIAMYLVSDATYMIMDEITNALDETNRQMLFAMLKQQVDRGKMILVSSHYREDIEKICDVMITIKDHGLTEIVL